MVKEAVILDVDDTICWKRDGYSYTGKVIDVEDVGEYYVEYALDPYTNSWTTVNIHEIDIKRMLMHKRGF